MMGFEAANADKFIALFDGKWEALGYNSQSEADMAHLAQLCFLTPSNEQVRRIFRKSELGKREKATKDNRYLDLTIAKIRNRMWEELSRGRELARMILKRTPEYFVEGGPSVSLVPQTHSTLPSASSKRRLEGRSLDQVVMRAIEWIWRGWIPKGYLTILAGETGAGKSTILADIVSRVTFGRAWPGEDPSKFRSASRVLWLGSEDSAAEMTVPRLKACGADLSKVVEITGVTVDGVRNTFSLQDDIEAVKEYLDWARTTEHPFSMLVIDPVTSYLPGQKLRKVDLNDAGQLRSILEPWMKVAEAYGIAIVCVTHFAKDTTRSMLHRVLGSAAFAQTCRSLVTVVERTGEDCGPHDKAMIQVKSNLPDHPGGAWHFCTMKVQVGEDERNGNPIFATRPNWQELNPNLTPATAIGQARGPKGTKGPALGAWLRNYFSMRPDAYEWVPVSLVKQAALSGDTISEKTWDNHSSEFLEKENIRGDWMCRLKVAGSSA